MSAEPWDAKVTRALGSNVAVIAAASIVLAWLCFGPFVGWTNELYHLALNSPTTATTFIMVFIILRSENRSEEAMHRKLDEIIHALDKADDRIAGIEADKDSGS